MAVQVRWLWAGTVTIFFLLMFWNLLSFDLLSQHWYWEDLTAGITPKDSSVLDDAALSSLDENGNDWLSAIRRSTEIIYRDSKSQALEFWLSQPPPKVYIYDSIPVGFSDVEHISSCVDRKFLGPNYTEVWPQNMQNCLWKPEVCDDFKQPSKPKQQKFFSYRQNYNMDVAYLAKFRRYPFQTTDPMEADIFVVPYPHKSHCLCHKDFTKNSAACTVPFGAMKDNVLDKLHYWESPFIKNAKQRHLFFHGADWLQQNRVFRQATIASMSVSLGPVLPCSQEKNLCGHVALPYVSTELDQQPFMAESAPAISVWSNILDRPYFVGAALGASKDLQQRSEFLKDRKLWLGETIHGKRNWILNMGAKRTGKLSHVYKQIYRNSTVCLVLPGDGCAQKRFYDVLMNGCIPLVPHYPSNDEAWPVAFHYKKCSTRITYPFSKGTFYLEPKAGFTITDLVATYNGTCGFPCLKSALEELASNPTELQKKHTRLRDYATMVKFGLDGRSRTIADAFFGLLVRLRHNSWHLQGKSVIY